MGQKVNPTGFRLGIFESWKSKWFAPKNEFGKSLVEDIKLRAELNKLVNKTALAEVNIDRTGDALRVTVQTARPGAIIGKKGQGIENIRAKLTAKMGKSIDLSVKEIKKPDLSAAVVASSIAEQIERRASFKRVMKKSGFAVMKSGAKGVKICLGGRLGGAEIARKEWFRSGSVPLHTLRSEVDYALIEAQTIYGIIGVRVWICRGEY